MVVPIDYFTKWVEVEALTTITEHTKIQKFFWELMVCRYRIPSVLMTDNGKQFDNPKFKSSVRSRELSKGLPQRSTYKKMDKSR